MRGAFLERVKEKTPFRLEMYDLWCGVSNLRGGKLGGRGMLNRLESIGFARLQSSLVKLVVIALF